jgi:hypothetical protein
LAPETVTSLFVLLPAFSLARLPVWNVLAVVGGVLHRRAHSH